MSRFTPAQCRQKMGTIDFEHVQIDKRETSIVEENIGEGVESGGGTIHLPLFVHVLFVLATKHQNHQGDGCCATASDVSTLHGVLSSVTCSVATAVDDSSSVLIVDGQDMTMDATNLANIWLTCGSPAAIEKFTQRGDTA